MTYHSFKADFENSTWAYDVDRYYRAKKIVEKYPNCSEYWKNVIKEIEEKYPHVKF